MFIVTLNRVMGFGFSHMKAFTLQMFAQTPGMVATSSNCYLGTWIRLSK